MVGCGTAISAVGPVIVVSYAMTGFALLGLLHLMAQMRRRVPMALYITDFVAVGLGPRCGAIAAGLYWCFWALVVAIEALAGANILTPGGGLPGLLAAIGILVVTAVVGGIVPASRSDLEVGFASLKVGAIVAFMAVALLHLEGPGSSGHLLSGGLQPAAIHGDAIAVLAGMVVAFFSLAGVEIVHTVADATLCSGRPPGRATALIGLRVFGICRMVSIVLVLAVLPWETIRPGFSPFTLALETLHHPWPARWFDAVILAAVLSTLSSALRLCSRVSEARRRIPGRLLPTTVAMAVLVVAACWPTEAYAFLVKSSSVLLVVVYVLFVVSAAGVDSTVRGGRWVRYALVALLTGSVVSMAWVAGLAWPPGRRWACGRARDPLRGADQAQDNAPECVSWLARHGERPVWRDCRRPPYCTSAWRGHASGPGTAGYRSVPRGL